MRIPGLEHAEGVWSLFPTPTFLRMPALGVDLSDRSIKYIRLSRDGGVVRPVKFGKHTVEAGIMEKGRIIDEERLVEVFKKMRAETELNYVYLSLPEEHGYLFQTGVDWGLSPAQTRHFVEFKLNENVPLSPEQAVFDYTVVPTERKLHDVSPFVDVVKKERTDEIYNVEESIRTDQPQADQVEAEVEDIIDEKKGDTEEPQEPVPTEKEPEEDRRIVSVSVYPREIVDEYLQAFEKAGFSVLGFEIEAQASARSVIPADDNGTYMIVDLGQTNAGLSVVNRGVVVFTSTLEVGGDNLGNAIQKYFAVSPEEAQKMKDEKGFLQGEENKELVAALFSTMSVLKDEIKKHCAFWSSQTALDDDFDSVERIILCGGNANLIGLPEYIEATVGVPTHRANAWVNVVSYDEYIPPIDRRHSFEYTTAIGLALQYARK